ncbi:MAG: diphthine--ammonia ligase [Cyclobacteriaceae bacterium]|nr:diphthine--ammonia ligase [Cyclobacteriaceae bacterium]MCX7637723.1 diphthine--ammonia ligase [Cyclobacteriaceae bacterium]MDW8331007.1 diphthine--ammonia ligase [Cyclobacteriaceae bacterium]
MQVRKTYFNWSSGKDSCLALYYLLQDNSYSVEKLLTTVNKQLNRVTMHGLRMDLLQQQVRSIGIPCETVELPENPSDKLYEKLMFEKVSELKAHGFRYAAFGDIFLEDLRNYREQHLQHLGIRAIFPLWKKDTRKLILEFLDAGFKAVIICVNAKILDKSFVGRIIDRNLINDLPPEVDPCGENGEFHTFCFDGPIFGSPVQFSIGETIKKDYVLGDVRTPFWFCDLIPGNPITKHELKNCPRCNREFECKAGSINTCHCSTVSLTEQERNHIQNKFDDCLCNSCLKALKAEYHRHELTKQIRKFLRNDT